MASVNGLNGPSPHSSLPPKAGASASTGRAEHGRLSDSAVLTGAFALALAILVAVAVISYRNIARAHEESRLVAHTHKVLFQIEEVLSVLKDAETGQRGYIITGEDRFLTPYRNAIGQIADELISLRRLIRDNPRQAARASELEALVATRLALVDSGIEARKRGIEYGIAHARSGEGEAKMDEVRKLVAAMKTEELDLLVQRESDALGSAEATLRAIVAGNFISLAIIVAAFLLLRRENRRRGEAERSARQYASEVETLYDLAPCGYHSLDVDGRFVRINRTELEWLGYSREEVLGRLKFSDLLAPESVARFRETFPRFKEAGRIDGVEFDLVRKDGSRLPVALSAAAVYDGSGNYLMSRSTMFDITERRRAEASTLALNAQLQVRAAELEAANKELESFSYSVSHDLRTPLRAIDGYSRMLQEDHDGKLDDEGRRLLGVIRESSQRMGQLIDDLLAFSRLGRKALTAVEIDMRRMAEEVLKEVVPAAGTPAVKLGALPPAFGDPALVRQVWANLLSNAVKFSGKREAPRVEASGRGDGAHNVYCVKDNGAGFDMRYYGKLFGVFQRLHHVGEYPGTGVGLAIVQRVVARHGGCAWAEGKVGEGAAFYFSLPKVDRVDKEPM